MPPQGYRLRPVYAERGALAPEEVAGVGQYAKDPGILGCRDDHAKIMRISRRRGPSGYPGAGGRGEGFGK